jgi:aspartate aminotransferase
LGITGLPEFRNAAARLAYGDNSGAIKADQVVSCQSLSGTGALRIGGEFLRRWYEGAGGKKIYVPTPTWGNHNNVFRDSGLQVGAYRYFNKKTNGLDFSGMMEDLKAIPSGSIILLHVCAHNPTVICLIAAFPDRLGRRSHGGAMEGDFQTLQAKGTLHLL